LSWWRRIRRWVARVTGVEAALRRRIEAERAKHRAEVEALTDHLERQIRVQRRRAQGAEKLYRTNRRRANELEDVSRVLDHIPRYEYGSLLPGQAEWADRWRTPTGLRILMFAKSDYAGSFYKWADAINEHTEHVARLVVTASHKYKYPVDLLIANPNLIESDWRELWAEADIIHIKDETGFMNQSNRLPPEMLHSFEGPRVFTQYGGYARKHRHDPDYQDFVKKFDLTISMTPDLCFEWLGDEPTYIPHSIDSSHYPFTWSDKPVIGHSPSTRARKGTEDFLAAVEALQADHDVILDVIEGVTHQEVMRRKRDLGIFFDQAGREQASLGTTDIVGWYGNSAIEAAVYGVPTVAHLSEAALAGTERAGKTDIRDIPIVNTPLGADGIRQTLAGILDMTAQDRGDLAVRTRKFIESFHDQPVVGQELAKAYSSLR
jgi:hypothetical protein